jgi:hypothetical protein
MRKLNCEATIQPAKTKLPTDAQRAYIKVLAQRAGVEVPVTPTRAHASYEIDRLRRLANS